MSSDTSACSTTSSSTRLAPRRGSSSSYRLPWSTTARSGAVRICTRIEASARSAKLLVIASAGGHQPEGAALGVLADRERVTWVDDRSPELLDPFKSDR